MTAVDEVAEGDRYPRKLDWHRPDALNAELEVIADARDENAGNASHQYIIYAPQHQTVYLSKDVGKGVRSARLHFQHGPIAKSGFNGITDEALLAVVLDRLQSFQTSKWVCRENALAITKIEEALHWLHHRTLDRTARGVDGTNEV